MLTTAEVSEEMKKPLQPAPAEVGSVGLYALRKVSVALVSAESAASSCCAFSAWGVWKCEVESAGSSRGTSAADGPVLDALPRPFAC